MRHWTLLQSSLFAGVILLLGALAGDRAVPVELPGGADLFNGRLAHAFESHYDAVFPAKTFGTNVWAAIDYTLFHEGKPGVVVGRQGWLYTDEEFKTYADAQKQIDAHLALIAQVRDALARRGTKLVVALVPAKARIYPEHLGDERPAALRGPLYAQARAAVRMDRIPAPDLQAVMNRCKRHEQVFMRTDTHWTPAGARCVAQSIGNAVRQVNLGTSAPARYRTRPGSSEPYRGDLMKFLPLDPYFSQLLPLAERLAVPYTEPAAGNGAGLLGEAPAPRVVLIGTSYSAEDRWNFVGALKQALNEDILNGAEEGKGPFIPMLEFLRGNSAHPRLVIWEIPERYLPIADATPSSPLPLAGEGKGEGAGAAGVARPSPPTPLPQAGEGSQAMNRDITS